MDPDNDEHVLELGANGFRRKWRGTRLLEHDRHDVVANVTFPQQLDIKRQ